MRLAVTLIFLASACSSDGDRPLGPGGGVGGGGGETVDGGDNDGATQGSIRGRLCLTNDLRIPGTCPSTTAIGGITIEDVLTGAKTTSEDSGTFTLPATQGNYTQLRVAFDDNDYRDVLVPIGLLDGIASGVELPLVPELVWQDLIFFVGINEPASTASIAAYFIRANNPVADVTVAVPEGTSGVPIYDGPAGPNDWTPGGGTGINGGAILLGVPSGSPQVDLDFTLSAGENLTVQGVALEPNVLTFITVALP